MSGCLTDIGAAVRRWGGISQGSPPCLQSPSTGELECVPKLEGINRHVLQSGLLSGSVAWEVCRPAMQGWQGVKCTKSDTLLHRAASQLQHRMHDWQCLCDADCW